MHEFLYHNFTYDDIRKSNGVVFTPYAISKFMIKNMLFSQDIIENPFLKVLDPSCGEGNIIFPLIEHVHNIFKNNLPKIYELHSLKLKEEMLIDFIISNNIYGFDINSKMCENLKNKLLKLSKKSKLNIFNEDYLFYELKDKMDIVISNPPYIGHKNIDRNYYLKVKENFSDIFFNKSDLMYAFFKKSYEVLREDGRCSFIVSRYFMESDSGRGLRKYITDNYHIDKIVDFYGIRPFKNVGIDPVILFLDKKKSEKKIDIMKFSAASLNAESFNLISSHLSQNPWLLLNDVKRNIFNKIEDKCTIKLKDISKSFQGIISGCDKAFIIEGEKIKIDKKFLRPWLKNSDIKDGKVKGFNKLLIYTDNIDDIDDFNEIKSHLEIYREKLENRRECKKGLRKWYELQWGRDESLFLGEKLIFPYKASKNNFAYDKGSFFSADIYGLILHKDSNYNYDELKFLLNSEVYDFYFKCFSKKLGRDLFEYYPYSVMEMKIPLIPLHTKEEIINYFNLSLNEIKIIFDK